MTEVEIAEKLANHDQRLVGVEHRVKDLEATQKEIRALTISVEKMAFGLEGMVKQQNELIEEQKNQCKRIDELEDRPAKSWNTMVKTAFTTIISTVAGALAVGIIIMLYLGMGGK